jgi:hypothetical protein
MVTLGVCLPQQVPAPQKSTECNEMKAIFQNHVRLPVPVDDIMSALTALGLERMEGMETAVARGAPCLPNQSRLGSA